MSKVLDVTSNEDLVNKVSDVKIFGEDLFKLICKASSESGGWMKSTKAMQVEGSGCLVQVTTQQFNHTDGTYTIAEALTFVPYSKIEEITDGSGTVIGRRIVADSAIFGVSSELMSTVVPCNTDGTRNCTCGRE